MKLNAKNRHGIAMLTVLLIVIFMIIIAGVVLNLIVGGIRISGSSRRYFSIFEAAESGLEIGFIRIEEAADNATVVDESNFNVGDKTINITVDEMFTGTVAGAGIGFGGSGYEGIGAGISAGGSAKYYRLESQASGSQGEKSVLESVYRKIIGVQAK